jgi:hypothetical protein
MSGDRCYLKSLLEPLHQISIFYILHHRYPELGKYQTSCCAHLHDWYNFPGDYHADLLKIFKKELSNFRKYLLSL